MINQPAYFHKSPLNEQAATILGVQAPGYKTYSRVINRYQNLAKENRWVNLDETIWPISKGSLTKFIKHLHNKVEPQTIISYLSALRHHHIINHMDWYNTRNDPLINQLLKTIEYNHTFKPTQQKEHITRVHLLKMKAGLNLSKVEDLLFIAVAVVAFYGLARLGELLPRSRHEVNKVPLVQALRFESTRGDLTQQYNYRGQRFTKQPSGQC